MCCSLKFCLWIFFFLFFLLCINDLPQSLKNTKLFFSADGTEIFYQQKDIQEVGKKMDKEFSSHGHEFIDSKLSIYFWKIEITGLLFQGKSRMKIRHTWEPFHKTVRHCRISRLKTEKR